MRPPQELFTLHREVDFDEPPVLVYAFSGFVDAGGGVRLAADHILQSCEFRLIATFDVDELIDYRARRPRMSFVVDHFASVEIQQIVLHEVTDGAGHRFLLLTGPEPDYQWLRFLAAVDVIVESVPRAPRRRAVGDPVADPAHATVGDDGSWQRAGRWSPAMSPSSVRSKCPATWVRCSNCTLASGESHRWG